MNNVWVKASERLPEPLKKIFFKYTRWCIGLNPNKKDIPRIEKYVGYVTNDGFFKGGWDEDVGDFLTFDKINIEWLDESEQPIIEDVGEDVEKAADTLYKHDGIFSSGIDYEIILELEERKKEFIRGAQWLKNKSNSIDAIGFAEFMGDYFKVHGGWFHRFADQRDLKNLKTTKELYNLYLQSLK